MHERLLYNSLFSFRVNLSKENTKHYLFDNIDDEVIQSTKPSNSVSAPAKEFTEDDLNVEDSMANDGWEYKVKSTPRKASVKDSAIDPNNPYVNKNLDADLSTVIGARRANRKQINTAEFLIKDKEKEKSDRQKNSDNDST